METIEYRHNDKTEWGNGPWQSEPDKVQWQDEATGLPCLAVRGPAGAWCGYVGVSKGHKCFEVEYSGCTEKCGDTWCSHSPEALFEVHGGLTFSDFCQSHEREAWETWRARLMSADFLEQARKYPIGDHARCLKDWGECVENYELWAKRMEVCAICHSVEPGEDDRVWWLGFDCAHSGDYCPKYASSIYSSFSDGEYRELEYAQDQCRKLARQLKEMSEK